MNFEIYCDESCQEVLIDKQSHNYMGIGGIWIPDDNREDFKYLISTVKKRHELYGEIKWNKVSPQYLDFYKSIIKCFFDTDYLRFRVIVIASQQIDNIRFNQSDAELGFYKFYYQLINHWILDNNEYKIFVDLKTFRDRTRLKVLRNVLDCSNLTSKVSQIQSLPSDESIGIQLADLLTGLVVGKYNNQITGEAKRDLINFTESNLQKTIGPTPIGEVKFNVFRINLKGGW